MAGEGIWWRHLRTSAGEEGGGQAGELAQAAGTAGAHGPWSQIPFPVWPRPLASRGAELPSRECERGRVCLMLLPVFQTYRLCAPESRRQK